MLQTQTSQQNPQQTLTLQTKEGTHLGVMLRAPFPPGDTWQYLETCPTVTIEGDATGI